MSERNGEHDAACGGCRQRPCVCETVALPTEPNRTRTRPDLCVGLDHPGATYNPWQDKTWCLCGVVIRDGNHHEHVACCDGPLVERLTEGADA